MGGWEWQGCGLSIYISPPFPPPLVNMVDRHAERDPDKTAIIWEKDGLGESQAVSYRLAQDTTLSSSGSLLLICPHRELLEMTCRIANALKSDGVKKGDRVAIYMPVSPLLVASMLACARIGAIHR